MKIKVPTKLIDNIELSISVNHPELNEKQKLKLLQKSVELWLFIYDYQQRNDDLNNLLMYANISAKELERFRIKVNSISIHFQKLLEILSFADSINVNDKYSPGSFTKAYRVNMDFLKDSNLTEISIDYKLLFNNIKNKSFWLNKYPDMKIHIKNAYKCKVDLDKYIHWLYNNVGIELKPTFNNGVKVKRFLTYDKIYNYIYRCLKLNLGNIWFKVSNEGRLYSSITNLPSSSIQFIKLDNGSIIEIDASNSQPLLLTTLIRGFSNYKLDVENGVFYDKLALKLGVDRKEAKILSFKYIFFHNNELKSGSVYSAMEFLYPGLISKINNLKKRIELAKELQKIESNIWVKSLSKLDKVFLVRHDSVLVEEKNKEIIEKIIVAEYNKLYIKIYLKYNYI